MTLIGICRMFKRNKHKPLSMSERFDTLVGVSTQIQGNLVLSDSVRIDGRVVGNIEAAKDAKVTVVVGATGYVTGHIQANRVLVTGRVEGNINATERVELLKDCLVQGDVTYGSIAMEHGAKLHGLIIQSVPLGSEASMAELQNAQQVIRRAQEGQP